MLKLDYHDDFVIKLPVFCFLPFTKVILSSWGEVSMCCHQLTQLGKLSEDTEIMDLWTSPLAKAVRNTTFAGQLHPVCTSWNSCPFVVKERARYDMPMYRRCAYPMAIEICLPDTHCNVGGEKPTPENPACIMCKRNFDLPHQPDLTEFLCRKAKPIMPYVRQLSLLGIAEPFWKDALFKVYEMLDFHRYKHRCEFNSNTNGICLNERTTRRFFEETEWSSLSFSIDAASPEVFRKIRRMDVYDVVLKNARRFIKMRDEFGGKEHHKICIWNNINLLNIDEMTKMVEMAVDLGVDYMVMLPTYDQQGIVKLGELMLCDKNVHLFKKASEAAMARAQQLGLNLKYVKAFDAVPPPPPDRASDGLIQLSIPG